MNLTVVILTKSHLAEPTQACELHVYEKSQLTLNVEELLSSHGVIPKTNEDTSDIQPTPTARAMSSTTTSATDAVDAAASEARNRLGDLGL